MHRQNYALTKQNQKLMDALSSVLPTGLQNVAGAVTAAAPPFVPKSPLSSLTLDDFIEPISSPSRRPGPSNPGGDLDLAGYFCRNNDAFS